jgi:hypothetical protein
MIPPPLPGQAAQPGCPIDGPAAEPQPAVRFDIASVTSLDSHSHPILEVTEVPEVIEASFDLCSGDVYKCRHPEATVLPRSFFTLS